MKGSCTINDLSPAEVGESIPDVFGALCKAAGVSEEQAAEGLVRRVRRKGSKRLWTPHQAGGVVADIEQLMFARLATPLYKAVPAVLEHLGVAQ